jgi:phosphonate transport system ATP-binding protein
VINFDNISKSYPDGTVALSNVTFEVPRSQFCVLLGHSGAGKSTILRLVNGLVEPTEGGVTVDGTKIAPKSLQGVRRKVSMIHQEFNLSGRSSVSTNVMSGGLTDVSVWRALIGWFPAAIREKCCELVELVGLREEHLKRRASALSGGQQQRVGIARSLMLDPLVILADEPIASLDPSASREVLAHLRSIAKERGCTILCCLHQVELAKEFADRIVGIEGGRVVFDLMPEDVDETTLRLIYKNYDDPAGESAVKAAAIENVLNVAVTRE